MYNSIYPVQIKPYTPAQNKQAKEEQESSLQSDSFERSGSMSATDGDAGNKYPRQEFPDGTKTTIDYSKSKVNISQILTDFKSTALAIGAPQNIVRVVDSYLALSEEESLKSQPDKKIIQSNLQNASKVLDDFISETLNKKSEVVKNWIEALFLQQVNYKSDPTSINPDFLVKLPDKETGDMKPISPQTPEITQPEKESPTAPIAVSVPEETRPVQKNKDIYIPQDPELRKSFIQGKKFASVNETDKALNAFKSSLSQAQKVGDKQAEGMICFEIGQLYDNSDNLEEALNYYHKSLQTSEDNNLKAKAYYNMAQIYDDVVYFEPAMEHYHAAISYAGEAENLNAQTKALSDIGNMYAEKYDVYKTHEYYGLAKNIALETKNSKTMGSIWSKSGDCMLWLNENLNALQDYKASAQFYENAESPIKMAKNYEKASSVMFRLGNTEKAKSLLQKALKLAVNASDEDYAQKLSKQLNIF